MPQAGEGANPLLPFAAVGDLVARRKRESTEPGLNVLVSFDAKDEAWDSALDRLLRERRASPHTVASYRDTFRLLLNFAAESEGITADDLVDRLLEARRVVTRFCLLFGLLLAAVLIAVARPLTGIYSEEPAIQDVAVHYLWLVTLSYGAYGLVMSVNAAFNGMGQPLPGVVISTCRVIVVFLPLALTFQWLFGLYGLFAATLVSNLLLGAAGYAWLGHRIARERAAA